jgi:hypothetical protein
MTGILGGGSNAKQKTAIGSLQFQTSQKGGVIPLVYGTTRAAPNLVDYDDFTATPASSGLKGKGGGGGKTGNQQYNYSASVILGMCQGPVSGFGTVWWDKNTAPLSGLPGLSTINLGADGQASDPFWVTNHPAKALGYSGTANFTLDNYQLGMTATLPNFSIEVIGIEASSGINGFDANPAAIVTDFLTNARYGAGFPAANLDSLGAYSEYCAAAGLFPVASARHPAGGATISGRHRQDLQQRDRLVGCIVKDPALRRSAAKCHLHCDRPFRDGRRRRYPDIDLH